MKKEKLEIEYLEYKQKSDLFLNQIGRDFRKMKIIVFSIVTFSVLFYLFVTIMTILK